MLASLPHVTLQDIKRVIEQYFLPVFNPSSSFGAVAVSAGKADEVEAACQKYGFEVERMELPSIGGEEDSDESMGSGSESESEGSEA